MIDTVKNTIQNIPMSWYVCGGVVLGALITILIVIIIYSKKSKRLNADRDSLTSEKATFDADRASLDHEMALFKAEQEAKADLNRKTEKEVAIDLYLKYIQLEDSFKGFQASIASMDSKLAGVKDYKPEFEQLNAELVKTILTYDATLKSTSGALMTTLTTVDGDFRDIVTAAVDQAMLRMTDSVNAKLSELTSGVNRVTEAVADSVDNKLSNIGTDFEDVVREFIPNIISQEDIQAAVATGVREAGVSPSAVKSSVRECMQDVFVNDSMGLKTEIQNTVRSEAAGIRTVIESKATQIAGAQKSE